MSAEVLYVFRLCTNVFDVFGLFRGGQQVA